jgi:hypothetical protein
MPTPSVFKKAKRLAKDIVEKPSKGKARYFDVKSGDATYLVSFDDSFWCECRKFSLYGEKEGYCSHIIAVILYLSGEVNASNK